MTKKSRDNKAKLLAGARKGSPATIISPSTEAVHPAPQKIPLRHVLLILLILILLPALTFWPVLGHEFLNWDDPKNITGNPLIKSLTVQNLKAIFVDSAKISNYYIPLTFVSFSVDHALFGLDARAFHRTSLILHIANGLLVFWFIYLLTRRLNWSFLSAALFAVHPLQVEAVSWLTERKGLLAAFFLLSSLVFYLRYLRFSAPSPSRPAELTTKPSLPQRRLYRKSVHGSTGSPRTENATIEIKYSTVRPGPVEGRISNCDTVSRGRGAGWLNYAAAIFSFTLSLLSKPTGLTLPFLLLLLDYYRGRPWYRRVFYEKVPFLALTMVFGLISLAGQEAGGAMGSREILALNNLLWAGYSVLFYLAIFFVPVNYSAFYPYPDNVHFVYIFITLGLIVAVIYFRKQKDFFFGAGFFLLAILPVIKVIPFGNYIAADRLVYVPAIGLSFLIGWFWQRLGSVSAKIAHFKNTAFFIFAAGIVGIFVWLSRERLPVWHDSGILWEDVLKHHPKVALAHANLGAFYGEKNRLDEAIVQLQEALALDPNYAKAHYNLAVAYLRKKESKLALQHFERALVLGYKFSPEILKMLESRK